MCFANAAGAQRFQTVRGENFGRSGGAFFAIADARANQLQGQSPTEGFSFGGGGGPSPQQQTQGGSLLGGATQGGSLLGGSAGSSLGAGVAARRKPSNLRERAQR